MQKRITKYLSFITAVLCIETVASPAHIRMLQQADSLFLAQQYAKAAELYETLYVKYGVYTPQTLLKLAHIKEVWGENLDAIYYMNELNEYYPDKKIFDKMKELADRDRLEGYVYSDREFFSTLYRKFQFEILVAIVGAMIFLFLIVVLNKIFVRGLSNRSPFLYMLLLAGVAYFINIGYKMISPPKKIVMRDNVLVMSEPSPGAKVENMLQKGQRVVIINEKDIWYKINYGGKTGYIRSAHLSKQG